MQKISPFLWFDKEAEEAANFYVSLFPDSKIKSVSRYGEGVPNSTPGQVMTVSFVLAGTDFTALNGGPMFKFNEAVSFSVECEDQAEVDKYWSALTGGGQESQCGWLKDKFGLSWQIIPKQLGEMIGSPDRAAANRAMQAMLKMKKIDIAEMQKAFAG